MLNSQRSKKSWWLPRLWSEQEPSTSGTNRLQTFGLLGSLRNWGGSFTNNSFFSSTPFVPDLLLILCVYLGIYHGALAGAAGAFFLGYLLDSCSGSSGGHVDSRHESCFYRDKTPVPKAVVQDPSVFSTRRWCGTLEGGHFFGPARIPLGSRSHLVFSHTIRAVGFTSWLSS